MEAKLSFPAILFKLVRNYIESRTPTQLQEILVNPRETPLARALAKEELEKR